MYRQSAIKETERLIGDLQAAVAEHKQETASALEYDNECMRGAAQRYEALSSVFEEILSNESTKEETGGLTLTPQEELMCLQASMLWHKLSSDYQQDKAVPTWNLLPRPGPTYFMSGETNCVHIFCHESCGDTTGPTCFSRNVVYARRETVGGAKSSDHTLSTLCDLLLGGARIGTDYLPIYRSGCGPEEKNGAGCG